MFRILKHRIGLIRYTLAHRRTLQNIAKPKVIWFCNDVAYIIEYALLPDQAVYLLALYIVWTVMAVLTYINWSRQLDKASVNEVQQ